MVTLRTMSWPMPRPGKAASELIGKFPMIAISSSSPMMPTAARRRGADGFSEKRGPGGVGGNSSRVDIRSSRAGSGVTSTSRVVMSRSSPEERADREIELAALEDPTPFPGRPVGQSRSVERGTRLPSDHRVPVHLGERLELADGSGDRCLRVADVG